MAVRGAGSTLASGHNNCTYILMVILIGLDTYEPRTHGIRSIRNILYICDCLVIVYDIMLFLFILTKLFFQA